MRRVNGWCIVEGSPRGDSLTSLPSVVLAVGADKPVDLGPELDDSVGLALLGNGPFEDQMPALDVPAHLSVRDVGSRRNSAQVVRSVTELSAEPRRAQGAAIHPPSPYHRDRRPA